MSFKLHEDLYGGEPPYPWGGAEEPDPVAVLLVAAEEGDLLVDPHDLPGEVFVKVDEKVEAFLEVRRVQRERFQPLDVFEAPAGG